MAREKKAVKQLSPDENLQQALVPVEEQPYRIPDNWLWIKAKYIAEIYTGNSISERIKAEKYTGQMYGLPFIATKDVGFNNEINYETNVKISDFSNFKTAPANTALLCIEGGSAGRKVGFVRQDVCFGNKLCAFVTDIINAKFIYYILQSQYFIDQFNLKKHGLIGGVSVKDLGEISFAVPPFAEQQRIVAHIERLFARLDEAKEKAQTVLDGFELRKAAILHKAFTGELTAKWRKEHGGNSEKWNTNPLGELTEITSSKRIYKEEYVESGIPFFRSSEVVELNDFGFTEPHFYISSERYKEIKSQYGVPEQGDLLVTSVGTIGKTWIVDNRSFYYKDGNLTQVKQCSALDMKYLQFYIQSEGFKEQIRSSVAGSTYNALTIVKFKKITIPVPPRKEQSAIVGILDSIFLQEYQAKEAAETVLDQIDTMKKAILARAFRGELGTNDPQEEWAGELVKEIL